MDYIVLDMEWNQPWPGSPSSRKVLPVHIRGEIIQIGAVRVTEDQQVCDEFQIMVKPKYYRHLNRRVSKLTGIKESRLKEEGVPCPQAIEAFRAWCGEDIIFLTWGFDDETYDIVLLLGPMYHLFTEEDQHRALSESLRVLKRGGVLFAAYCGNDGCMIAYGFGKNELQDEAFLAAIDQETFMATSDATGAFNLLRREHVEELMSHYTVTRLHFVGTDMFTNYMRAVVDTWDDDFFEVYLRYHFATCERSDLVGASHHFLDICRKD